MGEHTVSAEQFVQCALEFFGDEDPKLGMPWDKGARLAKLAGAPRSLLILDGLEPLQRPPGPESGTVTDDAIDALLKGLRK